METQSVPTFTLQNITVGEIPKELRRRFKLDRTRRIQNITLELEEKAIINDEKFDKMTFLEKARVTAKEAKKNGMTPEILEEILGENVKIFRGNFIMKDVFI